MLVTMTEIMSSAHPSYSSRATSSSPSRFRLRIAGKWIYINNNRYAMESDKEQYNQIKYDKNNQYSYNPNTDPNRKGYPHELSPRHEKSRYSGN